MQKLKNLFIFNREVIIASFIIWFIPFFVSMFLVNPDTKEYYPSFYSFKIIMFLLAFIISYYFYSKFSKNNIFSIKIPNTILLINSILDILILIILFNMNISEWLFQIFPLYVLAFYSLFYFFKTKR